jgi:hypothetical protein
MGDDAPRLRFEIAHQLLVLHVEDHAGHDLMPMRHQFAIAAAIAAELGQIVAVDLAAREQQRKAGEGGVAQIPAGVDDARVRKREMDEAGEQEIARHLVGDSRGLRSEPHDTLQIVGAKSAQALA